MNAAQRKALLTVLGLIVAGHAVRVWLLAPGQPPGSVVLLAPAAAAVVDRQRAAAVAASQPLRPGERLDLNSADAAALTRLPGIGAGLARRIVADRADHGPFRKLEDLDRVSGIGPALLRRVRDFVLQGEGPLVGVVAQDGGHVASSLAGVTDRPAGSAPVSGPLDLNAASEADLLRLPGIGPTKARAIVAYRQARGPFAAVTDLERVSGIGAATLAGLAGLVAVR
ncbi:MAG: helix-hairpin-helix domain-containing protein [Gemmatimonadota bacterium]|nr:helix-hairpin-helix domain-containing protein [Gemmatimonadota bacterium]